MTILSIWTTLETVRDTVLSGKIEALSSIASLLAAILAAGTLLKMSKDYIQGQPLDLWDLLRPIVLLTLVCLFRPLVLGPLDSLVSRGVHATPLPSIRVIESLTVLSHGHIPSSIANVNKYGLIVDPT